MVSSSSFLPRRRPAGSAGPRYFTAFAFSVVMLLAAFPAGSAGEKRIAIYAPAMTFSVPVVDRDGREYVGLFEILEPIGTATSRSDGLHWRVRYDNAESEFTSGKSRAKVRGHDLDLPGNFLLEGGRGLVPVSSLGTLLPRILGSNLAFNETARRLFIGNVGTHFTAQLSHTTPPRLVMNFSSPVNPTISTEPGKLRMVFNRDPVVAPGSPTLTFGDKTIPSATYAENNGSAEIVVNGGVSLMASFSNDGRTITVAPAPQPIVAQPIPPPAPGAPPVPASVSSGGGTPAPVAAAPIQRFYAVIDASHGGDDRGALLSAQLMEKDVSLALARRLRQELESRGISTLVLRDPDVNLSPDQRAVLANTVRPAIYICLHAASDGRGVRLYTALLPAGAENNGPFVAWDTAQSRFLAVSQTVVQGVAVEFQKKQIQVRMLAAPLRPLNNVTAAAIAVEVAPPGNDVMDLTLPAYQQNVVSAVAAGILAVHDRLGTPQ